MGFEVRIPVEVPAKSRIPLEVTAKSRIPVEVPAKSRIPAEVPAKSRIPVEVRALWEFAGDCNLFQLICLSSGQGFWLP